MPTVPTINLKSLSAFAGAGDRVIKRLRDRATELPQQVIDLGTQASTRQDDLVKLAQSLAGRGTATYADLAGRGKNVVSNVVGGSKPAEIWAAATTAPTAPKSTAPKPIARPAAASTPAEQPGKKAAAKRSPAKKTTAKRAPSSG